MVVYVCACVSVSMCQVRSPAYSTSQVPPEMGAILFDVSDAQGYMLKRALLHSQGLLGRA